MAVRKRLLIGVEDLQSIRLNCKKCDASLSFPIKKGEGRIPETCPNCTKGFFPGGENQRRLTQDFLDSLHQFKNVSDIHIQFEMEQT